MLCYLVACKRNAMVGAMGYFRFRRGIAVVMAAALMLPAAASAQQFSDSYTFLKAVRDRDGTKVTQMANEPGTTVVDSRDQRTGEAALHIVVKRRDSTWLSFLLGQGARTEIKDNAGNTPLMTAAAMGFTDGVQILLRRGARVDASNSSGETALIRAVQNRDVATVRVLLQSGANPKLGDNVTGMSARDYAARDPRAAAILRMLDEEAAPKPKAMGPSL